MLGCSTSRRSKSPERMGRRVRRRCPLREAHAPGRVPAPYLRRLAARLQALQPELADRLQHPEARFIARLLLPPQQTHVHQRSDTREDVGLGRGTGLTDGPRRLQREAAGEDRQPPEQRLVGLGRAGRGSRRSRRASSAAGPARRGDRPSAAASAVVKPGQQRPRRQEGAPRGGQLDRQGQPVQPVADLAATAAAFSAVRAKSSRAARARSTKRRTAGVSPSSPRGGRRASSGRARGGTAKPCSPERRSTARLVARTARRGQAARRSVTSGAASSTCSQLSRSSSACRSRRNARSPATSGRPPASRTPSTPATAEATRAGSRTGARGTNQTPSGKAPATSSATRSASRVLPTPPGPVRVSRRTPSWRSAGDGVGDLALAADEGGEGQRQVDERVARGPGERDDRRRPRLGEIGREGSGHSRTPGRRWIVPDAAHSTPGRGGAEGGRMGEDPRPCRVPAPGERVCRHLV